LKQKSPYNPNNLISNAKDAFRRKGIGYVIKSGIKILFNGPSDSFWFWYYNKFKANDSFIFCGEKYHYFYSMYSRPWRNERAVEIPIVWEFIKQCKDKTILELGNVLSHQFDVEHDILDKYEKADGIINEDVVDFKPRKKYDLIVSISTIEHIGWDETPREPKKVITALENLKNLLAEGGKIIITFGLSQNSELDNFLAKNMLPFDKTYFFKREPKENKWSQVSWEEVKDSKYISEIPTATGLVIGIIENKIYS